MSLSCITPLASTMVGQKQPLSRVPSIQSRPFSRLYPARRSVAQVPINMALITDEKGITRRIGNHHPNLWGDNFLQSLSISFHAPSYSECSGKLINEVKGMFNALRENCSSVDDLYGRLKLIDDIERLGIDRHFKNEMKEHLDYVYRYWNDANGIGCGRESPSVDLNTTALGFRILRLHRYGVSSVMLQQFTNKDGKYLPSQTTEEELRSILNLFRASLIAFPKEQAMDDAKAFSTSYLKNALPNINNTNLSKEIQYNLEYGWHTNVPRLEARTYIDLYGDAKTTNNVFNSKFLELAKIDFNMIQSIQQQELQTLSRWWTESGLTKLDFARHRHVEFYFWAAAWCIEPKYSTFRIGFAKMATMVTCLDDIYDTYGTIDELEIFTKGIKRWDLAYMEGLPEFMKLTFKVFDEALRDMAQEAEKTQGRDTLDYARKAWEVYIDAYLQEAKWLAMGSMPSFEEYLENGKVSSGARVVTLQPVLSLDAPISEDVIKEIDYPSRFNDLLGITLRLRGDTKTFKAEADRGEEVSCITCYMKDHRGSTEEDALEYLNYLIEENLKQLNWEYLKSDNVPLLSKDHAYGLSKGLQLLYKERDGFSVSGIETKNIISKTMIEPVPM